VVVLTLNSCVGVRKSEGILNVAAILDHAAKDSGETGVHSVLVGLNSGVEILNVFLSNIVNEILIKHIVTLKFR